MPTLAAIGGLVLLVALAVWALVSEAKSGAARKEALKAATEVIDATKRFNAARRESVGMPRRKRVALLLQKLREGTRP